MKRIFWDIETSPDVVLSWKTGYKINLDYSNIIKERAIICIGYKWEDEKEVHALSWDRSQNDKSMLRKFLDIAGQADELVAHNGDNFDMPWFKTRCLFHGLTTMPDYKTVDTLQWARRKFYFNSNKMDYIAQFLKIGAKIKTEFNLWKSIVLDKDARALRLMLDYCKQDVVLLEKVWKRLSLVVPHKSHVGVMQELGKWTCPRDGSERVRTSKTKVTAAGTIQYQMQCRDCGGYFSVNEKTHDDYANRKVK